MLDLFQQNPIDFAEPDARLCKAPLAQTPQLGSVALIATDPPLALSQPTVTPDDTVSPLSLMSSVSTATVTELSDIEHSPLFDDVDLGQVAWTSLFDDDTESAQPLPAAGASETLSMPVTPDQSVANLFDLMSAMPLKNAEQLPLPMGFALQPEPEQTGQHFAAAPPSKRPRLKDKVDEYGITVYTRKTRSAALKPITVAKNADPVAAKRARNTEAARRSRARRMERMDQLEACVRRLTEENAQLKQEIAKLRGLAVPDGPAT